MGRKKAVGGKTLLGMGEDDSSVKLKTDKSTHQIGDIHRFYVSLMLFCEYH